MGRLQKGHIYEASGSFFVRFWSTEIVNGALKRVQRSHRLCFKDDKYYAVNAKAVKLLRDEFMHTVNSQRPTRINTQNLTIVAFWEQVYLPHANEVNPRVGEPNLKPSTVAGYEQIWQQHLEKHFADTTLGDYETATATNFLTELAKTQGRNTLHHIRSLMSGIFAHAISRGYLTKNPIKDATTLGKTAQPKKTGHYSLREALAILDALSDYVECQLVMSLAFFWGLRPSEIRGLKWEDFCSESSDSCKVCQEDDWEIAVAHCHVRRAVDKEGNEGRTKTDEAEQPLPMMVPIAIPLQIWREKQGFPTKDWVFANSNNNPTDLRDWVRSRIAPTVRAAGLKWKGLYAGRRGAATMLLQLTGNALASQQLLRHKPGSPVTARHYLKAIPQALLEGAKQVENAVEKALEETKEEKSEAATSGK